MYFILNSESGETFLTKEFVNVIYKILYVNVFVMKLLQCMNHPILMIQKASLHEILTT